MGSSLENVKQLKKKLSLHYEMSDLGEIQSYLGMRICQDRSQRCIRVDQSGYIRSILDRFGMADANPHPTPLPAGADVHLIKYTAQAMQANIKHYQSLIGSLLYSMCKSALGQIFPLLYHIWHSMQQIPHHNIYALQPMFYPIF